MRLFTCHLLAAVLLALAAPPAPAEDGKVTYRERGAKGVQTASGKIESESVAGVRVGGKTISSADIADVQYDVPAAIRLTFNSALSNEAARPAEALNAYQLLLREPAVLNLKSLKRHLEYKIAALTAAQADDSQDAKQKAIAALTKFKKDHPDAWQVVPLTRTLGRLLLDKEPPDADAARQAYEDLARASAAPPEVRQEFAFLVIDLLLDAGQAAEAQKRLAALPADDPRVQLYKIGTQAGPGAVKQLEDSIDKTADPALKATAYNLLGDCYRRDPQHKKDALYAYLWVDVIYNQDAVESAKAAGRLASLFHELKDEERARKYRDRLKGK